MKQQEVFKKIGGILKELNEQYEYLNGVDGELNDLELELFLANSHFLTDHLLILSKLNSQNSAAQKAVPKPEAPREQKFFEPLVQSPAPKSKPEPAGGDTRATEPIDNSDAGKQPVPSINLESSSADDSYSYIREEPETIRHELILDEADWDDEDEPYETVANKLAGEEEIEIPAVHEKPAAFAHKEEPPAYIEAVEEVPAIDVPAEPVAAAAPAPQPAKELPKVETPKPEVLTINERIMAQMAEKSGAAHQLHAQAITDLKPAINLNDKLLFIKDLFNGYSLAYSEAIEILNRFNSFEEADLFLKKNYVVKNNWEAKAETSAKFYNLLKRRYA